jgi:hypothetical protein
MPDCCCRCAVSVTVFGCWARPALGERSGGSGESLGGACYSPSLITRRLAQPHRVALKAMSSCVAGGDSQSRAPVIGAIRARAKE